MVHVNNQNSTPSDKFSGRSSASSAILMNPRLLLNEDR
jgi:hypothetical protein